MLDEKFKVYLFFTGSDGEPIKAVSDDYFFFAITVFLS